VSSRGDKAAAYCPTTRADGRVKTTGDELEGVAEVDPPTVFHYAERGLGIADL